MYNTFLQKHADAMARAFRRGELKVDTPEQQIALDTKIRSVPPRASGNMGLLDTKHFAEGVEGTNEDYVNFNTKTASYADKYIEKTAYVARDKFHAIWRAAGGYAKESQPWQKAFTPGLTPNIENKVLSKVQGNESLHRKYTGMLSSRSSITYGGNDVGTQLGGKAYSGLGKKRVEVSTFRALKGIHKRTYAEVGDFAARGGKNGETSVSADYVTNIGDAGLDTAYNKVTGEIVEQRIKLVKLDKNVLLKDQGLSVVTNNHEKEELLRDRHIPIMLNINNKPTKRFVSAGIGTHGSYGVLGKEQVSLRDVPDDVYSNFMNRRVHGVGNIANDQDKINLLSKQHGVQVKPYGTDLRYRPGEVKAVDNASDKQMVRRYSSGSNYVSILKGAEDTGVDPSRVKKTKTYLADRLARPANSSPRN